MLNNLIKKSMSGTASAAPTSLARVQLKHLPWEMGALEPIMSGKIIDFHYGRHHRAYVTNLNKLMEQQAEALATSNVKKLVSLQKPLHFNGGGHINHTLFWDSLCSPADSCLPENGPLYDALIKEWGSLDEFKKTFNARTANIMGSGWGWLVYNKRIDCLSYREAYNQDPVTDISPYLVPIIGIDVWEHAYYLDYQNGRAKYLANIWKIVNWQKAEERLIAAKAQREAEMK